MIEQVNQLRNSVLFLSDTPPIRGISRAIQHQGFDPVEKTSLALWKSRLTSIFLAFARSNTEIRQIRYIGATEHGFELLRIERKNGRLFVVKPNAMQHKEASDYFKKTAPLVMGQVHVSTIKLNREHGQIERPAWPALRVSTPVFSEDGIFFGLIIINIDATNLLNMIKPLASERFHTYLLNKQGDFILHPERARSFGFEYGQPWRWEDEFQLLSPPKKKGELLRYKTNTGEIYNISHVLTFPKSEYGEPMTLAIASSKTLVDEKIWRSLAHFIFVLLSINLIGGGLIYLFARQRRQLSTKQAQVTAIVNSAKDGIISLDLEGKIQTWNPAATTIFGYSVEEAIGKPLESLMGKTEHTILGAAIACVKKGESSPDFDITWLNKKNQRVILAVSTATIQNKEQGLIGVAITFRDVTFQRGAEAKIFSLNAKLKKSLASGSAKIRRLTMLQHAILEEASYAIIAADIDGTITLFNPAAEHMLGYRANELVGKQTPAFFHDPKEVETRAEEFSQELNEPLTPGFDVFIAKSKHGLPNMHEWTYIRKDKTRLPVLLAITALRNSRKKITGYLGIASDISVQLKNRQDLLTARDQLSTAADVAELGIWTWNLDDNSLVWNDRMFEMYQQPIQLRHSGVTFEHWRSRLHPEDADRIVQLLKDAVEGKAVYHPIFRVVWPDGSIHHIQAGAQIEYDNTGKPIRVTGINSDVTVQRSYEALLVTAKKQAEAANEAKSVFLANMSHEIRTPMNAVVGLLELLQKTSLDHTQANFVEKIKIASRTLLFLLNDILDLSKIEAGKLTLDARPFSLDKLLSNLSPILSVNLLNKNIEVLLTLDPNLPAWVIGDDLRLQQILLNLASNALKFTEQGEVEIRFQKVREKNQVVTIEFSVLDTGLGISKEQLKLIFKPFSQAESSTTRRFGGSGLGLTISQKLVHQMGGKLLVKSIVDKGSTFYFRLAMERAPMMTSGVTRVNQKLLALRCLVVDDHSGVRQQIGQMLHSFGWDIDPANSGEEAISKVAQACKAKPYDIIFVDWHMPGLNGWDTCQQIRQQFPKCQTPLILMLTAYDRSLIAQKQEENPTLLAGVLDKPITPSMLYDAAATVFQSMLKTQPLEGLTTMKVSRLKGLRLLLVEDNPTNQIVAHDLLVDEGATVDIANNGQEGIEAVQQAEPLFDLVLMDIQMPKVDGYTASREIRRHYDEKRLPIIAMTANTLTADRKKALAAGMNEFISKPFNMDELVATIQHVLGRDKAHDLPNKAAISSLLDFDMEGALQRFAGNKEVYYRALANFTLDVEIQLKNLPAHLDNHLDLATRILHTLKGLASTIGANAFATVVDGYYQELKAECSSKQWKKIRVAIETAGHSAVDIANNLLKNRTPDRVLPAKIVSTSAKLSEDTLVELLQLLEMNNMKALNCYDQLQQQYLGVPLPLLKQLGEAIERLDFIKAAVYCQMLLDRENNNE